MFIAIPPFYCIIYRLTTIINNDFSTSNEGEVDETWGIVSFGTPCRHDLGSTPTRRMSDGIVDTGARPIYFEADVDVRAADRIAVNNMFYKVTEMEPIYGFDNEIHHYEGRIEVIDWTIPDYLTQWVDESALSDNEIVEVLFDYTTASPKYLASLAIGDIVGKVGILIESAFEAGATISVGNSSDNEVLMETTDNIPTVVQYYEVMSNYECETVQDINIYITPPVGATIGSGHVFLEIVRAI